MKWIDIREEKPKAGISVLVFQQGYNQFNGAYYCGWYIARYVRYNLIRQFVEPIGTTTYPNITHWMPLPGMPEKVRKETPCKPYS